MFTGNCREQFWALGQRSRSELLAHLLCYVFKGCDQRAVRSWMGSNPVISFDFKEWRLSLHNNGTFLRDAKVYAYGYFCSRYFGSRSYVCGAASLSDADCAAIRRAVTVPVLWERLTALAELGCSVWEVDYLDAFCAEVINSSDLKAFTRSLVHSRLSFVISMFDDTRDELLAELKAWAIYAVLRAYPKLDDVGHALAIAKTTMKNVAINIAIARRASTRDRVGHKTVSADLCLNGTAPRVGYAEGFDVHASLVHDPAGHLSGNAVSIDADLLPAAIRRAHWLLVGNHSDSFSSFLGAPNEELAAAGRYDHYLQKVCAFLGLQEEDVKQALRSASS